jgi:hypothetical protein
VGRALVLAVMVLTILYGLKELHETVAHCLDAQPTTNGSLDSGERLAVRPVTQPDTK